MSATPGSRGGEGGREGFLLVVEGIDGTGKSTLLGRLERELSALGKKVLLSREPTQGVWGKRLRESARAGRLSLEEEIELFMRDRMEHVQQVVCPALQRGEWVLLDRYYFSSAAYQGARGADPEWILHQNEAFAPQPDLVLLLDCPPEDTLRRIRSRGDEPDQFEKLENLNRVREVFLRLKRPYLRVLDASETSDSVYRSAWRLLEPKLQ
jgi:dTMP kinase